MKNKPRGVKRNGRKEKKVVVRKPTFCLSCLENKDIVVQVGADKDILIALCADCACKIKQQLNQKNLLSKLAACEDVEARK